LHLPRLYGCLTLLLRQAIRDGNLQPVKVEIGLRQFCQCVFKYALRAGWHLMITQGSSNIIHCIRQVEGKILDLAFYLFQLLFHYVFLSFYFLVTSQTKATKTPPKINPCKKTMGMLFSIVYSSFFSVALATENPLMASYPPSLYRSSYPALKSPDSSG